MTDPTTTYSSDREAIVAALRHAGFGYVTSTQVCDDIVAALSRVAPSKPAAVGDALAILRRLIPIAPHESNCSGGLNESCDCALGEAMELTRDATPEPKPAAVGDGPSWDFDKLKPLMMGEYVCDADGGGNQVSWTTIKDILRDALKHGGLVTPAPSGPAQARQIVDKIRELARERGWAIGEHGSLARDIDLIAMPWTKGAVPASDLKAAICVSLGYRELDRDTRRPHGRVTALLVAQDATHEQELFNRGEFIGPPNPKGQWIPPAIDLSFMPLPAEAPAQAVTEEQT